MPSLFVLFLKAKMHKFIDINLQIMRAFSDQEFEGEPDVNSNSKHNKVYLNKKLKFGFEFSGADGELGNPSEDTGDLPQILQKPGHQYNSNLEDYNASSNKQKNEIISSMHIADKHSIGMSYTSEDNYLKD